MGKIANCDNCNSYKELNSIGICHACMVSNSDSKWTNTSNLTKIKSALENSNAKFRKKNGLGNMSKW